MPSITWASPRYVQEPGADNYFRSHETALREAVTSIFVEHSFKVSLALTVSRNPLISIFWFLASASSRAASAQSTATANSGPRLRRRDCLPWPWRTLWHTAVISQYSEYTATEPAASNVQHLTAGQPGLCVHTMDVTSAHVDRVQPRLRATIYWEYLAADSTRIIGSGMRIWC